MPPRPTVLLTGATGYVGGRLLPLLESRGYQVRCLARRPESLRKRVRDTTEVVAGDLLDPGSLVAAMEGIQVSFYLVHSMGSGTAFEEMDRRAAGNFAEVAARAGVKRIIYLGGLGEDEPGLSPHLRSRHEVGRILRESGVPTLEFRASIVIGAGSLSFEMVRSLVETLPVMVTPKWVSVPAQPIGIDDLVEYLAEGIEVSLPASRVYEIGGADCTSYVGLMREYAHQRGLRRLILRVPVLTPWLSSLWLGLVTPLYVKVGRILIESIRHPTIVRDTSALEDFDVRPGGFRQAIARALKNGTATGIE